MAGKYWDKAWSLVDGCTPVSAGCDHCWSAAMAYRFWDYTPGECLVDDKKRFRGVIYPRPDRLSIPTKTRKPTVFSLWNDLYHEAVPDDFIFRAFDVMCENPRHTYLLLTKRAHRMAEWVFKYIDRYGVDAFPSHIWFGISAENQAMLDERLPHLLRVPGKRFLSLEPLLGEIDLNRSFYIKDVQWVIVGQETGPHKRPCNPAWINLIIEQCQDFDVPVWVKVAPVGVEIVREKPLWRGIK
jgi:protein gp37